MMTLTNSLVLLSTCATLLAAQNPRDRSAANVPARSQGGTLRKAIAHDGTEIPFRVAGTGTRYLLLGPFSASALDSAGMKPWIEGLGKDYRLIFIDYPGEPKLYTLTPATVARDYLAIADAAGATRFAYYGYSW